MEINGHTLRALRTLNGYDLKGLSDASHVSMSYISEIENGHNFRVTATIMKKLADALSVPIAALGRPSETVGKAAQ